MSSFRDLPKAELHLHLEGSVEPETLCELDSGLTLEEIRRRYQFHDFAGFLESYKWVAGYLKTPENYGLIARRLLERLASQNVLYAEINLSAGVMVARQRDVAAIYDAVHDAARRQDAVKVRWIFDAVRQFGAEAAMQVARLAVERAAAGVVAFGIGGDEQAAPAEWFAQAFGFARAGGLKLVPHAGETAGPESVWAALRLGADRIGHGIRSIDDPALVAHLREKGIPLEVCISSNVATGAVRSLARHPVRRLFDAGVPIVLNTDDPALFRTTLTAEYDLARREFGFSETEIEGIAGNAFRYAFPGVG